MSKSCLAAIAAAIVLQLAAPYAHAQGNRPPCNAADSTALVDLYLATGGDNWTLKTNWMQEDHWVRSWHGVEFEGDMTDRVVKVKLPGNNLTGSIPSTISNLTELEQLDLSNNNISALPPSIASLPKLTRLDLSDTQITELPSLAGLGALETLGLGKMGLTAVPSFLGSMPNLEAVNLSGNQLSGALPGFIGSMTNLQSLGLAYNQISELPQELSNLRRMKVLSLSANGLSGELASLGILAELDSLEYLDLFNNDISGTIPEWMGEMTSLKTLILDSNDLEGSIPAFLANLTNLESLRLMWNRFTGAFPAEISALPQLRLLWIARNYLSDLPVLDPLEDGLYQSSEFLASYNRFTFEDIAPNLNAATTVTFNPQYEVGFVIHTSADLGETKTLAWSVGGEGNQYAWLKNGAEMPGETSDELVLENLASSDVGSYTLTITNPSVPGISLETHPIHLVVQSLLTCAAPGKTESNTMSGTFNPSGCGPTGGFTVVVLSLEGEVELYRGDNAPVTLRGGETLIGGDRLYTGIESSATLAFADNSTVEIGELSDLKISSFADLGDAVETRLSLKLGEVAAKVQRESAVKSDFQVKTPTATCSVRGTDFLIRHDVSTSTSEVVVGSGEVTVIPDYAEADSVKLSFLETVTVDATSISAVGAVALNHIEIDPGSESIPMIGVRQFIAHGVDATGRKFPIATDWTAGGGTIDDVGYYVAGMVAGSFDVTAVEPNSQLSTTATVTVTPVAGVSVEDEVVPTDIELFQNYPNPFGTATQIRFSLSRPARVELAVYDLLGALVHVIERTSKPAGEYVVPYDASGLAPGVYFCRLKADRSALVRPMIVMR